MPIYVYRCTRGHTHERRLPIMTGDTDPKPCPDCGQPAARVMAAPRLRRDGAYSYKPSLDSEPNA